MVEKYALEGALGTTLALLQILLSICPISPTHSEYKFIPIYFNISSYCEELPEYTEEVLNSKS